MNHDMFDDIIRQKANSHESDVPPGTWEAIQQDRKRRRAIWFWLILPCTLAGLAGLFWMQSGQPVQGLLEENQGAPFSANTISNQQNEENNAKTVSVSEQATPKMETSQSILKMPTETNSFNNQESPGISQANEKSGSDNQEINQHSKNLNLLLQQSTASKKANPEQKMTEENSIGSVIPQKEKVLLKAGEDPRFVQNSDLKLQKSEEVVNSSPDKGIPELLPVLSTWTSVKIKNESNALEIIQGEEYLAGMPKPVHTVSTGGQKGHWSLQFGSQALWVIPSTRTSADLFRINNSGNHADVFNVDKVVVRYKPSMGVNIGLQRSLNRKWDIGLGLQYDHITEDISMSGTETQSTTQWVQRLVNQNGQYSLVSDSVVNTEKGTRTITAQNSYQWLSMPVYGQYHVIKNKTWSLALQGGVILNMNARYNNLIEGNFEQAANTGTASAQWGFDLMGGLQVTRRIGGRWGVYAAPRFRLNKTLVNKEAWGNHALNQFNLGIGLKYDFEK